MSETLYLGLDGQTDISSYSLLTSDRAEKLTHGRVNLEGFPKLLEDTCPSFLACAFSGLATSFPRQNPPGCSASAARPSA